MDSAAVVSESPPPGLTAVAARDFGDLAGAVDLEALRQPLHVIIPKGEREEDNKILDFAFFLGRSPGRAWLTSVTIPGSIKSIGRSAFRDLSGLASVIIEEGVATIRDNAFRECHKLCTLELPSSIREIGTRAFQSCTGLVSVAIPAGVTIIAESTFQDCSSLASLDIPSSVITIDRSAFMNCSGLASVDIPSSVLWIKTLAFRGCTGLASVIIPGDSEYNPRIGDEAFRDCTVLKTVHIPDRTRLGDAVFCNCRELSKVVLPGAMKQMPSSLFYGCSMLESVVIPKGLSEIGPHAFSKCTSLASVSFPNTLKVIGYSAFQSSGLRSIVVPRSVGSIGAHAFAECNRLTCVCVANGVRRIATGAFARCEFLLAVVLPPSIWVDKGTKGMVPVSWSHLVPVQGVFANCRNLSLVAAPARLRNASEFHFAGCPLLQLEADSKSIRGRMRRLLFWSFPTHKLCGPKEQQWVAEVLMLAARLRGEGSPLPSLPPELWFEILERLRRTELGR